MGLREQTAPVETKAANLLVYRNPAVVSHYASLDYLTPCERHLFDTYLTPGMAILDMGVGGGRTTPYLSQKASRYVGIDYSEEMVRLCRDKFPRTEFLVADASDLSAFSDGSFDAIVFSFNGLDYLFPEEQRWKCLRECWRVLRAGGVFVFSSHNPRVCFCSAGLGPGAAARFCRKTGSGARRLIFADAVDSYRGEGAAFFVACDRANQPDGFAGESEKSFLAGRRLPVRSRPRRLDDALWTPARVREELTRFDFRQETVLGDDIPGAATIWLQTGITTCSPKPRTRQVSLAHKCAPRDSARPAAPRSVECAGPADGASGSFLYLGVGGCRGASLPGRR